MESTRFDQKEWGITFEEVLRHIGNSRDDQLWFYDNKNALRERYPRQWIAVRNQRVVMADKNHDALVKRLNASPEGRAHAKIFFVPPEGSVYVY